MDELSPEVRTILDEYRQSVAMATEKAARSLRELPPDALMPRATSRPWDRYGEPEETPNPVLVGFWRVRDYLARQRGD